MSSQQLTQGTYYGQVIDAGWTKSTKSLSHGIALKFRATHVKQPDGQWAALDEASQMIDVDGVFWVIKSDGALNDIPLKQMHTVFGWDGDPDKVTRDWFCDPERAVCQFLVKDNFYNGKNTPKVDSVWPKDSTGPGVQHLDANGVRSVKAQFGGALKAALGGGPRAPGGVPKMPPAPGVRQATIPPARNIPPQPGQGAIIAAPPAQREPGSDDGEVSPPAQAAILSDLSSVMDKMSDARAQVAPAPVQVPIDETPF